MNPHLLKKTKKQQHTFQQEPLRITEGKSVLHFPPSLLLSKCWEDNKEGLSFVL